MSDPKRHRRVSRRSRAARATASVSTAAVALAGVVLATGTPAVAATDTEPSFELIASDLEFILAQIQISEAHAAGGDLLCDSPLDESGKCVPDPMLPWGLRTVDGSFNNLEFDIHLGSGDEEFPRLLPIHWRGADPVPPGVPPFMQNPPGVTDVCEAGTTCYEQTNGFVYDSSPRTISNLIVDSSTSNPAAVDAAADREGSFTDPVTGSIYVPDSAPDEGLSAPVNAWMTFFGQFFDHGLDLVDKGGNGTIVVPLEEDDPLWDVTPPNQRFMMLTRATNGAGPDGVLGTTDDVRQHNNETTAFVDQNQTYTSHPSHQAFLREYRLVDGSPQATGRLLDGANGGLATWDDAKRQAREVLGIELGGPPGTPGDYPDVVSAPHLVMDLYGNFIPGDNGFPQLMTTNGVIEGNPDAPISTADALRTGHAFLEDIAHGATQDPTDLSGYDNVLLGQHFVTGDGRGNENIALTAVHHVFHSEHNRLVAHADEILHRAGNEALLAAFEDQSEADDWTYEERLFQVARFANEMQYQHLVFEEFARRIQPNIDPVVFNENSYDSTIDPSIVAEFAHVVYRFGHSMLTEDIAREGFGAEDMPLLAGFLNPVAFHCRTVPGPGNVCPPGDELTPDQAAGSIINGTTDQTASQIDELVTDTLRNSLLGLPLDLAAINIMRGRDAGVPPLQTARQMFFDATGNTNLEPYTSWADFGLALKNGNNFGRGESTASLVNFVAAYGTHPSVLGADTLAEKRAAADVLVNGAPTVQFTSRIAGPNRFATSAAISSSHFGPGVPVVYVANGGNFPDAMAAGPAAAQEGGPVLLVQPNAIPAQTALELIRLNPGRIVVLGDPASVNAQVMASLATYTEGPVARIAGSNRFATAVAISAAHFEPGVETLYVADGTNYPDALAAAPVAARDGSPILLVPPTGPVPVMVQQEILRLDPGRIVVLGGTPSVSAATMAAIDALTDAPVTRIAGADRFQTAVSIVTASYPSGADTVYVTTGLNYPDALSVGAVAGLQDAPVLLVPTGSVVPAHVAATIVALGAKKVIVLGDTASVSAAQMTALEALAPTVVVPADRAEFMNSTGAWAGPSQYETVTGLEGVDFWVGGLAEALDPFGGMLGSTFNFVFEKQLENLQFGDRFYYLFRNQGNQLFAGLEANSFSSLVQRNTDASLIPADVFGIHDPFFDVENLPSPLPPGLVQMPNGQLRWDGDEHIEIHGHRTLADNLRGGQGDDALWGYGGNDRIEGGSGNDSILGGIGNDILTDTFGDDNIKGQQGNDAIDTGYGFDLALGGSGDDFIVGGHEAKTVFAGTGQDIVVGGTGRDNIFGNEGDDWIEGGDHADLLMGDNSNQFQNDRIGGADVLIAGGGSDDYDAEGGDDIMVAQLGGTDRFHGMFGFDYVTYYGEDGNVDADLNFNLLQPPSVTAIRDRFLQVEALSGGDGDDILRGRGFSLDEFNDEGDPINKLTEAGLDRIAGLEALLRPNGHVQDYALRLMDDPLLIDNDGVSNLLMGGNGSDMIEGRYGDDFIEGDAYLRVQLEYNGVRYDSANGLRAGVFAGSIDPGDIVIIREIVVDPGQDGVVDTAVYEFPFAEYEVTYLGDDYWRVFHTGAAELEEADGNDILHAIEMLQFDGQCFTLNPEGATPAEQLIPCGVAGTVVIDDQNPLEGRPMTATVTLADGVSATGVRFNWQQCEAGEGCEPSEVDNSLPDTPDGLVDTFVPTNPDVGYQMRVTVTFIDGDGILRSIVSEPTTGLVGNVNDAPTPPTLTPTEPVVGNAVVASSFTDPDGTEAARETGILYEWQGSTNGSTWQVLASGLDTGILITEAHVGMQIRARIVFTDDHGTEETMFTAPTAPVGVNSVLALVTVT